MYRFRAANGHPTEKALLKPYLVDEPFEAAGDIEAIEEGKRRAGVLGVAHDVAWVSVERAPGRNLLWASKPGSIVEDV